MSNKKKKYNPNKTKELNIKSAFKHLVVVALTGQDIKGNLLIDTRTFKPTQPTPAMQEILINIPHHWTCQMIGFGVKTNGQEFLEYQTVRTQNKYVHEDIREFLNEQHQKLLQGMNKSRLVAAGWVGSISDTELTETQLIKLFGELKAWHPI